MGFFDIFQKTTPWKPEENKTDLAKTRFKHLIKLTGIKDVSIVYAERGCFGGLAASKNKIEFDAGLKKNGYTLEQEDTVILHELGHIYHDKFQSLIKNIGIFSLLVALVNFLMVLVYLAIAIIKIDLSISLMSLFLAFCFILAFCFCLSVTGSIRLYGQIQADEYARYYLAKQGKKGLFDNTLIRLESYIKPNGIFDKLWYTWMSLREETRRRISKDWKWIYLPFIKEKTPTDR